jgi:DNA-binding IclR family transcriptional regulator
MGTSFHNAVQLSGLFDLDLLFMHNPLRSVDDRTSGVQSVERAIAILKAFSQKRAEIGVTELSQQLDLHKSTTSRLLSSLHKEGLVEENPITRKYRLGMVLATLGGLVLQHLDVTQAARPLMLALAETTQETVILAVRDRAETVNVAQVPSPQTVKHMEWVGQRGPLHCTATGKVLLAYSPVADQEAIIYAKELPRYTPNTMTDPDRLCQDLAQVREQGYAVGREELEIGLNAVAAPVCDHSRDVVAAISVSGPAFRLSPDRFSTVAAHVQQTALKLSSQLGCDGAENLSNYQAVTSSRKGVVESD